MKKIVCFILSAAALAACGRSDTITHDSVTVFFRLDNPPTKGLAVDADCISDCCVMAYDRNGNLVVGEYCPDGALTSMSFQFARGAEYIFYYVCNIGDITHNTDFARESNLSSYQYRISDYSEIVNNAGAVPMSGRSEYIPVRDGTDVSISLTRCVALISIQIDDSALRNSSMTINSMKIKNTPSKVALFEDSRAGSEEECFSDGDRADSGDIVLLNNGGEVSFYMFENDQGELLPGNTSDGTKYFEDGSPNADMCSFVEFSGNYLSRNGTITTGTFTYRFYLGGNTTSDFTVSRNMHYVINISLTDNGVFKSDWRTDSELQTYNISSLGIYPSSYTFEGIGQTTCLLAYSTPESSEPLDIIWTSSNPDVVTVDSSGNITSTGEGSAIVLASWAVYRSLFAICSIRVNESSVPDIPVEPPAVSPITEVFADSLEYYVALNDTIHVNTFLKREDGSIEPVSSRFYYDISSTGTGFAISPEENVIQGEGLGDVKMYFTYDGHRSPSITIHVIDPNSHTHIFN